MLKRLLFESRSDLIEICPPSHFSSQLSWLQSPSALIGMSLYIDDRNKDLKEKELIKHSFSYLREIPAHSFLVIIVNTKFSFGRWNGNSWNAQKEVYVNYKLQFIFLHISLRKTNFFYGIFCYFAFIEYH